MKVLRSNRRGAALREIELLFAQLFSWSTVPLPESPVAGQPALLKPNSATVNEIRARLEDFKFHVTPLDELEELRLYDNPGFRETAIKHVMKLWSRFVAGEEPVYDRPFLLMHPNGDWTLLADAEYLPTSEVTQALRLVETEVVAKWRLRTWNWSPVGRAQKVHPMFSSNRWTPLCIINLRGEVQPGWIPPAVASIKPPPILSGFKAVEMILRHTCPLIHRLVQANYQAWTPFLNQGVETIYENLGRAFTDCLAEDSEGLSVAQVDALKECMKTVEESVEAFAVLPGPIHKGVDNQIHKIDNPAARVRCLQALFNRIGLKLMEVDLANSLLWKHVRNISRALWAEILPISVNRTSHVWEEFLAGSIGRNVLEMDNRDLTPRPRQRVRKSRNTDHNYAAFGELSKKSKLQMPSTSGPQQTHGMPPTVGLQQTLCMQSTRGPMQPRAIRSESSPSQLIQVLEASSTGSEPSTP